MSSSDSPNSARFIKTFSLNAAVDLGLLKWLDRQAALSGYTTVIIQALYDAWKADRARRNLPEPPDPEILPEEAEIVRQLGALRSCLRMTGFWPSPDYVNERSDDDIRSEITSQIKHLPTVPLLVLMFISSILTLARLKGVPYE